MKITRYSVRNKIGNFLIYWFDRSVSGTVLKQFGVLLLSFAVMYLIWLIIIQFLPDFKTQINKDIPDPKWSIIAQMIDPGNQHMVGTATQPNCLKTIEPTTGLRWFVLLISLTGTFVFGGLLISTLTNIFEQRVHIVREGMMNYRYKNHMAILGGNKIVIGLVHQLISKPEFRKSKIVILTSLNVPEVKRLLMSELSSTEMKRLHILYGDRTSKTDLNRLWLPLAKEVYILGENNESDHDSRNNASLSEIEGLLKEFYKKEFDHLKVYHKVLDCNILFDSQTTYVAHQFLNFQQLDEDGKRMSTPININAFSFYEKWAQKVFVGCQHGKIVYSPLDFEQIPYDSDKYVHVIIAGMTRMGFAIGVQAARLGHYANFEQKKTRITFIDTYADREINYFASRYQSFYDAVDVNFVDLLNGNDNSKQGSLPFINVELNFINGNFESPEVREMLVNWTSDPNALTTIAVCFNDPGICLAAGLYLPMEIYSKKLRVIIQQVTAHSILSLLWEDQTKVENRYKNVNDFGMVDDCIDLRFHNDLKAKAINFFYYSNSLPDKFDENIKLEMNNGWKVLRERFKWSSRYNAESIPTKIRAIGADKILSENLKSYFTDINVELLARMEHARWNVDTLLAGFEAPSAVILAESTRTADLAWEAFVLCGKNSEDSKYAVLKRAHETFVNSFKREMIHPCLVPYDQLSEFYKDIDRKLVNCIPVIEEEFEKQKNLNS